MKIRKIFQPILGAKNVLHDQKFRQTSPEADKLCNLCRNQGSESRFDLDENIETNANTRGQFRNDAENSKKFFFHNNFRLPDFRTGIYSC